MFQTHPTEVDRMPAFCLQGGGAAGEKPAYPQGSGQEREPDKEIRPSRSQPPAAEPTAYFADKSPPPPFRKL